jgi:hypothetical protein
MITEVSVTLSCLGTETMVDFFNQVGTTDYDRERLNMSGNTTANWSAHALGMLSWTAALRGLTSLKVLLMLATEIWSPQFMWVAGDHDNGSVWFSSKRAKKVFILSGSECLRRSWFSLYNLWLSAICVSCLSHWTVTPLCPCNVFLPLWLTCIPSHPTWVKCGGSGKKESLCRQSQILSNTLVVLYLNCPEKLSQNITVCTVCISFKCTVTSSTELYVEPNVTSFSHPYRLTHGITTCGKSTMGHPPRKEPSASRNWPSEYRDREVLSLGLRATLCFT